MKPNYLKKVSAKLIGFGKGRLRYERGFLIVVEPNDNLWTIKVPDIREMLKKYPEVEVWVLKSKEIIKNNLKQRFKVIKM
jgi:hypothetical protein